MSPIQGNILHGMQSEAQKLTTQHYVINMQVIRDKEALFLFVYSSFDYILSTIDWKQPTVITGI